MTDQKKDWNGSERRKKIVVNMRIQLRHIGLLAVSFFLILLLVEIHIYSLLKSMLPRMALAQDYDYLTSLGLTIMVEMLIVIIIVGIINIIYMHRIVGPVGRITRELDEMTRTDNYRHLKFRKKDELKPLLDEINNLIDKIKK